MRVVNLTVAVLVVVGEVGSSVEDAAAAAAEAINGIGAGRVLREC